MMLSQSGLTTRVGLVDGAHRARFAPILVKLHSPFPARWIGRLNNPILNAFVLHPLITMPNRQSCGPVPDSKSK